MNWKLVLIIAGIFIVMAWAIKYLYDDNRKLKDDNTALQAQVVTSIKEAEERSKAFALREQSLIKDRKEIQNEYEKLLELRKTEKHYSTWADGRLPDSVSLLLQ